MKIEQDCIKIELHCEVDMFMDMIEQYLESDRIDYEYFRSEFNKVYRQLEELYISW